MKSISPIWFVECTNPECQLRFPLDLSLFKGHFCPRCGSPIVEKQPATLSGFPEYPLCNTGYEMVAVLDNIRSVHNVGAIFRSADGAGFKKIFLCGITPTPQTHPELKKTALGAQSNTQWEYCANAPALIHQLQSDRTFVLVLEATPASTSVFSSSLPAVCHHRIALVVGNEPAGIDPQVIALADASVFLPMLGVKESLNVSVAFGIAAYWLRFVAKTD